MIAKRSIPALTPDDLPTGVTMAELEGLRIALDHWRRILSRRLPVSRHYSLVLRHGAVLTGAINGYEVPSSQEVAGFPVPVGF